MNIPAIELSERKAGLFGELFVTRLTDDIDGK